jgi:hypothetical protein
MKSKEPTLMAEVSRNALDGSLRGTLAFQPCRLTWLTAVRALTRRPAAVVAANLAGGKHD